MFTTHKLQINYRSNQEILSFANVLLDGIEANQYARIQLQANSLATVTEQSFLDKVKFHYHRVLKQADLEQDLPVLIRTCIKPYIDACLAKNEQVAFLAYKRKNINIMQEALEALYPTLTIANITSPRFDPSTLFSSFIQRCWKNLQFAPTGSFMDIIVAAIQAELTVMMAGSDKQKWKATSFAKQLYNWQQECRPTIQQWQNMLNAGQLTLDQFMENVKDNMLQYEIRQNAVKQALLSSKKRDKAFNDTVQNANIILSTVHGAKGLEFDNVVVLFQSSRDMPEDQKRIYYVALTRAMKTEYVLAFDNVPNPKVKADYDTLVNQLHQRHPAGQTPAAALITGVPSKNSPAISITDLLNGAQNGIVIATPGIMPLNILDPDAYAAAQATAKVAAINNPLGLPANQPAPTQAAPDASSQTAASVQQPVTPAPVVPPTNTAPTAATTPVTPANMGTPVTPTRPAKPLPPLNYGANVFTAPQPRTTPVVKTAQPNTQNMPGQVVNPASNQVLMDVLAKKLNTGAPSAKPAQPSLSGFDYASMLQKSSPAPQTPADPRKKPDNK